MASLSVNETTVAWSGDFVRGLEFLNHEAWPTTPIKWKLLETKDFERGHVDARMLNMGTIPLHFALMVHDDHADTVRFVALSDGIEFEYPDYPVGVHLAVGREATTLVAQWTTFDAINASRPYEPVVEVTDLETGSKFVFGGDEVARTVTYGREDLCGAPANSAGWVEPGYQHSVEMRRTGAALRGSALVPGRRYAYRVGDFKRGMRGDEAMVFWAPVDPSALGGDDDGDKVYTILAFADMGEYPDDGFDDQGKEIETEPSVRVARMVAEEAEWAARDGQVLAVHNGDISYARGYGAIWHSFFAQIEPLASRVPYMTTIGNHERDWPNSGDRYGGQDSGGECGVPYMSRLAMPRQQGPDKPWYSFRWGPVHFVQLSTEHPFERGTEQHEWAMGALEAVNRTETPWLVAGFHRPMYIDSTYCDASNASDCKVADDLRFAFRYLFYQYRVDMTWVGHHHSYQRTCAVDLAKGCDDKSGLGLVNLVVGNAGAVLTANLEPEMPSWFQVAKLVHGYTKFEVTRKRISLKSIDVDGNVIDEWSKSSP